MRCSSSVEAHCCVPPRLRPRARLGKYNAIGSFVARIAERPPCPSRPYSSPSSPHAGAGAACGPTRPFSRSSRHARACTPSVRCSSDGQGRITYGELADRVARCAAFLRRIGIERGDVVTIQLPNRIAFPIVYFALELIGAVANKVNPDFRSRELDYILRFSNSRAFVCPSSFKGHDYVAMARELRASIPGLAHIIVAGEAAAGEWHLERGHRRSRAAADGRTRAHEPRRGVPHGLHQRHHRQPQVRAALLQHDAVRGPADQRRHGRERARRAARLPAGRSQLGLSVPLADDHERQPCRAARALLGARRAGAYRNKERITYIATAPASIVAMLNEPDLARFDVARCAS